MVLMVHLGFAQINQGKKKPCYERAKANPNARFVDWDCGKLAGVVDCNDKLGYDEPSNTVVSASDGSPFDGTCETCHSNGILERRITFVNGKENGTDTAYYRSSCPMVIREHVMGAENGRWAYYYDSTGQEAWEINYYLGKKHGRSIYFTKEGDTTLYEVYNNGVLNGTKKNYYPGSKIEKSVDYENGVINGAFRVYNINGQLVDDLRFKDGKKDGKLQYYYNDGSLMRIENYDMGVKNGEFKSFYIQGHPMTSGFYKKGREEGKFLEYYPNQKVSREVIYKKGEIIEEHRFNEYGEETYTFGVDAPEEAAEDDLVPMGGELDKKSKKAKKKRQKKEKKEKD